SGVALSDGSKGERIKVKNTSSKREIEAYVSGRHLVLVTL
ncbi:MAG: flagella basal body P-ring formation protein FlgA, partial [Gammaproteobacteria bacterium]|nr:flagella basal body P-ring formation protein FlgA [Gammaproteobacteria bacterium]